MKTQELGGTHTDCDVQVWGPNNNLRVSRYGELNTKREWCCLKEDIQNVQSTPLSSLNSGVEQRFPNEFTVGDQN